MEHGLTGEQNMPNEQNKTKQKLDATHQIKNEITAFYVVKKNVICVPRFIGSLRSPWKSL